MPVERDILKELRKDRKLKQSQVGAQFGMSAESYAHYESGRRDMSVCMLETLADMFETSTDYLLGRTAEETPYPPRKPNP